MSDSSQEKKPSAKKRARKWPIVVGVVVVVLVAAGAGFLVWHEQPGFCNAICHDPMDPYVEGYYSNDPNLLVSAHAQEGYECLDCHEPTLSEQVSEAVAWATGDFYSDLAKHDLGTEELCLNEACHVRADIAAATEDWGGTDFNPHASHVGKDVQCGDCHSVHRESELYCNKCHNATLPEGWVDPA